MSVDCYMRNLEGKSFDVRSKQDEKIAERQRQQAGNSVDQIKAAIRAGFDKDGE